MTAPRETPELELAPMKARCDAATHGPWKDAYTTSEGRSVFSGGSVVMHLWGTRVADADVDFITHARMDVPNLIREVERLRAALSRSAAPEIEDFWNALANGWDIEPRSYFEQEAAAMGFKSPVEMAVHWMWKRHAKEWPNAALAARSAEAPAQEADR